MLPFVGIVAIGLLVVAGKLFFVSGVRVDRNAVLLARNRQPVEPGAAQAETGERKVVPPSPEGTGDSSDPIYWGLRPDVSDGISIDKRIGWIEHVSVVSVGLS